MNEWGIDGVVNLSGMYPGPPRQFLETQLAAAATGHGRIAVFMSPDFRMVRARKDYGAAMAASLTEAKRLGAIGLKITKGLGLGFPAPDGRGLMAIDDRGLDPLWSAPASWACRSPSTSAIRRRSGSRPTPDNERWDELRAHPEWSFHGPGIPAWQELYDAFERLVARHKKTTFIGVHFGNDPEDPTTSRACSTATRTSSSTPPRASPRSAATRRTRCAASSPSIRTASCSAPTPASAPADET